MAVSSRPWIKTAEKAKLSLLSSPHAYATLPASLSVDRAEEVPEYAWRPLGPGFVPGLFMWISASARFAPLELRTRDMDATARR
jgi:hypothetical protein